MKKYPKYYFLRKFSFVADGLRRQNFKTISDTMKRKVDHEMFKRGRGRFLASKEDAAAKEVRRSSIDSSSRDALANNQDETMPLVLLFLVNNQPNQACISN